MFLRQSTSQLIEIGPFLDFSDGVTEEVALTIANTDIRLSKDGAVWVNKNSGGATHREDGWYDLTLDATDTATVGELKLKVQDPATHLPVWETYWVIEEAVYDDFFGAAAPGYLRPTTAARTLDVTAAGEAGIDLDNTVGTLVAAQFGADFIDATKVAADVHAETADAVLDEDMTAHQTLGSLGQAIGDPVANTETMYDAVVTDATGLNVAVDVVALQVDVGNILADTADMQPKLGVPSGPTMSADIENIQTTVDTLPTGIDVRNLILPNINVAFSDISVFMRDSTDHFTPQTGLTLTVTRSIDGGAFVAATGTPAEIGNGYYQFDASAADMNGRIIVLRFVAATADDTGVVLFTGV